MSLIFYTPRQKNPCLGEFTVYIQVSYNTEDTCELRNTHQAI